MHRRLRRKLAQQVPLMTAHDDRSVSPSDQIELGLAQGRCPLLVDLMSTQLGFALHAQEVQIDGVEQDPRVRSNGSRQVEYASRDRRPIKEQQVRSRRKRPDDTFQRGPLRRRQGLHPDRAERLAVATGGLEVGGNEGHVEPGPRENLQI